MKSKQFNKTFGAKTGKGILDLINSKKSNSLGDPEFHHSEGSETLHNIWKNLLGHSDFTANDDFFHVGGNSLKAVQLVSRLSDHFSINVQLTDVFLEPTFTQQVILIQSKKQSTSKGGTIIARHKVDKIPLSFSQERLWVIDQLEGSLSYHIPAVFRLTGQLNKSALTNSFQEIVNRHEVLRTIFIEEDGKAYQQIKEKNLWNFEERDISALIENTAALQQYVGQLIHKPFDLRKDDMLRVNLLTLADNENLLVVTLHHIASDGWSMPLIFKEFSSLYRAFSENVPMILPPSEIQYADYAIWQREYLKEDILERKINYWKEKLLSLEPLELLTDYPRAAIQSNNGAVSKLKLSKDLSEQLQSLSNQEGATLFMTVLACLNILLSRYTGQEDICVGTAVANRNQHEVEGLVGFFVNTLALRSSVKRNLSFRELLKQVKVNTIEAYQQQEVPFEKVVEAVVKERDLSRTPIFQVMLVQQDVFDVRRIELKGINVSVESVPFDLSKFELTFSFQETENGIEVSVLYNRDLFKEETVKNLINHFHKLLSCIIKNPVEKISNLKMLSAQEEHLLLVEFNNTEVAYPKNKNINDLFEEKALEVPENIAVIFGQEQVTYGELNRRSNQVARYLKNRGIQEEALVPICIERSTEMIIGILGILKAGAAYVPVDPDYPEDRIKFILEDIGANLVLSSVASRKRLPLSVEVIELYKDQAKITNQAADNLSIPVSPHNLAYVIYTSGSTGKPKGVMIEHQAVLDHCFGLIKSAQLNHCKSFALFSPLVFDAGHAIIFSSLFIGASLNVLSKDVITDGEKLASYLIDRPVDCIKIVPSVWLSYINENNIVLPGKVMIFGGESFSGQIPGHLIRLNYTGTVYNHYGPTEATIGKCIYQVNLNKAYSSTPIGRPFSNTQIYIADQNNQLVPVGVAGELCIAGEGVARGYLNRPDLTAEKFIPNVFSRHKESKLYKTGDKVRWNHDGEVEYLGRIDEQVKIRGHRIELGEIENELIQIAGIQQAAVKVIDDKQGNKILVGYIVSEEAVDKQAIFGKLQGKLPEYMIPAIWISLDQMPLTSNGKINKKALPNPDFGELVNMEYTAPRNEVEEKLTEIWQELLGIERVGIHDNFFELGGDSILTIQVVSRARRSGIELQPKDIFIHQSVGRLSLAIFERTEAIVSGEQGILRGASGLLPIQQWYLQKDSADISYFNQSILLKIDKQISGEVLNQALVHLTGHHDALRFRYIKKEGFWQQEYGELGINVIIDNIASVSNGELDYLIKEVSEKYQRSLDIEKGELIRVVLMKTPTSEKQNRLLIVIHHLAVDGVSWRILVEDLELLLNVITNEEKVTLGYKSSSYRQWYETLKKYGQGDRLLLQKNYWKKAFEAYLPLPTDKFTGELTRVRDTLYYNNRLSRELTTKLLKEVPGVYHTEINDILISALAKTIFDWTEKDKIIIGLEGHGREEIAEGVDISQTVGWFTSLYPVFLELNETETRDADGLVKSVKEQLRQIPDKGLGYGVLKYINEDKDLQARDPWDIVFNYLGQVDNVVKESQWFTDIGESIEAGKSGDFVLTEKLSVNSIVKHGQLMLTWTYSIMHYQEDRIQKLAFSFITNLEWIITKCLEQQSVGLVYTPSDYGFAKEINYKDLDRFLDEELADGKQRRDVIDGLYPLSGLQQGMLFHNLYHSSSESYISQFCSDLINLNLDFFNKSWEHVIEVHSILRSAFFYDKFKVPVQFVYKDVELPVEILDYQAGDKEHLDEYVKAIEKSQREKGFDFKIAPLTRLTLIRLSENCYRMIWTYHHIISDGWSMSILMEEFLNAYESLSRGQQLEVNQIDKYEEYIRYIERRDKKQEQSFWKNYLGNIESGTLLPFIKKTTERTKGIGSYSTLSLNIDAKRTGQIKNYLQKHHLTANTLMQGVWSCLLHNYTGEREVVFGVIVSGRPDDLPNIERRVGMYINTLPLHTRINKDEKVEGWLTSLQEEQVNLREYQYTPLSSTKEWSGVQGDLFDTLLVFENYPVSKLMSAREWKLKIENVSVKEQTNYPLTLIIGAGEHINIQFSYNTELIDERYIEEIGNHFERVLMQVAEQPQVSLGDIKLLSLAEERQLLEDFNNTAVSYPKDKSIIDLFEEQVKKTPDKVALLFEEEKLTYSELNKRANRLARYLRKKGVKEETLVPICIERSLEMIVGILGILKSGGAYVPIDPEYPEERIKYMLEDTGASVIVSSALSQKKLPESEAGIIEIDSMWEEVAKEETGDLGIEHHPSNLAYIIYTSGSTGKPKGVMIEHRNVYSFICWSQQEFSSDRFEIVYASTSMCFDLSVFEFFYPLSIGKPIRLLASGLEMGKYLSVDKGIMTNSVPVVVESLLREGVDMANITAINMAGEPIPAYVQQKLDVQKIAVRNLYGPTEDTTYSTIYRLEKDKPILIGKPISNTKVIILNQESLVPVGVAGEICLSGDGVARGYLHREELTAEKFVPNPYSRESGSRMYKTGDLGRWLPDGNIEYLGRIDNQVKIRGYRIELGEIESALAESGLVKQALVVTAIGREGVKRLVGYIVSEGEFDKENLMKHLRLKLPEYMVPQVWVSLENLPLTPNGKINRKALPSADVSELSGKEYEAPRNEVEEKLARIWQELLGIERVGIHDNFFELGGHSLLAMRLIIAINKELGVEILFVRDIFQFNTINDLSKYLEIHMNKDVEEKYFAEYDVITI